MLKAQIIVDGRKQQCIYSKEEATSSTCHNDLLMIPLLIKTLEERVVSTGNIPGPYLRAKMKDITIKRVLVD